MSAVRDFLFLLKKNVSLSAVQHLKEGLVWRAKYSELSRGKTIVKSYKGYVSRWTETSQLSSEK
jgi:hypothetical protein